MAVNSKFSWLLSGPVIQAERSTEVIEAHCYRIEVIPAQDDETLDEIHSWSYIHSGPLTHSKLKM